MIKKPKTLKVIKPNAGISKLYKKRITDLVSKMQRSVMRFLVAEYRRQENEITQDTLPSQALKRKLDKLMAQWKKEFNDNAEFIVRDFITKVTTRSSRAIETALKASGIEIQKRMTRAELDALRALIMENVSLIKSIPDKYFADISNVVYNSVIMGRDIKFLSDELEKRNDITQRRAVFIARDQANKVTEQMTREKFKAVGIKEAIWIHTAVGKKPRQTHIKMNGKRFPLTEGLYDSAVGRKVFPGELYNCFCTQKAIIPEIGDE